MVTALSKTQSPASVRKIHRVLSLMLDMAVGDGRLVRNVAAQVNLPRPVKHERRDLTHAQVDALAQACGHPAEVGKHRAHDERTNEMYRLVVLFLAYTGVRFGEMAALRVRRIDLQKRRAVIAESVTPVQGLGMVWAPPRPINDARCRFRDSSSTTLPDISKSRSLTISSSPVSAAATHCGCRLSQGLQAGGRVDRHTRSLPARAAAHGSIAGDRVGSGRQGRAADARLLAPRRRPKRAPDTGSSPWPNS